MITEHIGRYRIEQETGQGGFAVVYKAKDLSLNRDVAIKVLRANWVQDTKMVKRFYREAQCAAALRHPHIVRIYEVGELDSGQVYLVMEYLPGLSLAEILRRKDSMSCDQVLAILAQMADALDYAHGQGLIHRDVSPKNIMVERKANDSLHSVLTDFGLVKVLESNDALTSGPLGTVEYMAPEQIAPERQAEIGPATDIYALGVMAYKMLTGRVPFTGNLATVLLSHLQDPPPDPCTFCDTVSPDVAVVLLKALAKDPIARYPNARQMIAELRRAMLPLNSAQFASPARSPLAALENANAPSLAELPRMLCISAGAFWMGSEETDFEAAANEKPRHRERLSEYEISKYPVTNVQYQTFVQATGHAPPAHWGGGWVPPGKELHPVVNTSCQDALDYCRWLSKIAGQYYDLPTESEWEKAARGGEPQVRSYPWGNTWIPGYCNSAEEGIGDTTPVDRYETCNCSPYGVVDTVGNVWEWTCSLYRPYRHSPHYIMSHAGTCVVRGGSWKNDRKDAHISVRGRYEPDVCRPYLGFRVVRRTG